MSITQRAQLSYCVTFIRHSHFKVTRPEGSRINYTININIDISPLYIYYFYFYDYKATIPYLVPFSLIFFFIYSIRTSELGIRLGVHEISSSSGAVTRRVSRIIVNRDYNSRTLSNDYALIELASEVTYTNNVGGYHVFSPKTHSHRLTLTHHLCNLVLRPYCLHF